MLLKYQKNNEYWEDCIECALKDVGLDATKEQIESIAADVCNSHENYRIAFHQPSSSDRYYELQREYEHKQLKNEDNWIHQESIWREKEKELYSEIRYLRYELELERDKGN